MSHFRRRPAHWLAATILTALGFGADARAQPPRSGPVTTILVRPSECEADALEQTLFLRLLEVELASERVRFSRYDVPPSAGELVVEVGRTACSANAREAVVTLRRVSHEKIERTIALTDLAAEARPRALALAVAELIRSTRASWRREAEAVLAAEGEREEPVREPRPPYLITARDEPDRGRGAQSGPAFALQAAAAWRTFLPAPVAMFGAQASVTLPVSVPWLFMRGDVSGLWGTTTDPLGKVNLASYSGGVAVLFGAGRNPMFFAGPHLELGYASASGVPGSYTLAGRADGSVLVSTSLIGSVRAKLRGPLAATAEVEAGTTLNGLRVMADDRLVASMRGGFVAARLGLALAY